MNTTKAVKDPLTWCITKKRAEELQSFLSRIKVDRRISFQFVNCTLLMLAYPFPQRMI